MNTIRILISLTINLDWYFYKSTICTAHDLVNYDQTKHIEIDRFYIKEKIREKILSIEYILSAEQCADVLTKGLPTKQFHNLISKLRMLSIHSCEWGGVLKNEGDEQFLVFIFDYCNHNLSVFVFMPYRKLPLKMWSLGVTIT